MTAVLDGADSAVVERPATLGCRAAAPHSGARHLARDWGADGLPSLVSLTWDLSIVISRPVLDPHLDKNAQRSKTVKVLSRGYVNESSGASTKARFQKSGSS